MSLGIMGTMWGMHMLSIGGLGVAWGIVSFFQSKVIILTWEILLMSGVSMEGYVVLDWLAMFFMGAVLFISAMVFVYSDYYMADDLGKVRFYWILMLFVVSMLFLILSPNMISMLLGWDGLGLVSFCLVIYYQSPKSYGAGMLTVLSNRVGDVALLLGVGMMIEGGGWGLLFGGGGSTIYGGLLMLAAMTKSAQMPFSAWLPAAMAAPTPVSALVHSSTLVTAGVYVLIRGGWMMGTVCQGWLFCVSVLTMFMAGAGAVYENDLKKVIALSTLSQLGLMMAIISAGEVELAYFHLITHAVFKSLLFLCAGYLIHQLSGVQDLRGLSVMGVYCPNVSVWMGIANFALCGAPFLAGFYSKDAIMESMYSSGASGVGVMMLVVSCGLTVAYTVRLYGHLGVDSPKTFPCSSYGEGSSNVLIPLSLLGSGGVISGAALIWLFFGGSVLTLGGVEKLAILLVSAVGLMLGWFVYQQEGYSAQSGSFLGGMWFLPLLSTGWIGYIFTAGLKVEQLNEHGWDGLWGGEGGLQSVQEGGQMLTTYQRKDVKVYLLGALTWITVLLAMGYF